MRTRARLLSVVTVLTTGVVALIGSTQSWLIVTLTEGASEPLIVAGADALAPLAPLSLAACALAAAISIVGLVLRYVFGVLTVLCGLAFAVPAALIALSPPTGAVAGTITAATGLAGHAAVSGLIAAIVTTPWPAIVSVAGAVLTLAGVYILITARGWGRGGRRYRTASETPSEPTRDAIDSWDDLSRGTDPTA